LARTSLALSPDGGRLVSTRGGDRLGAWNTETGENLPAPDLEGLTLVVASKDGQWFAGGGDNAVIRIWHAQTGQMRNTLEGQRGRVAALAFSPDSSILASASSIDGLVWVWRLADNEPILVVPEAADNCMVETLAFHPDGRILAAGGIDWLATSGSDGAICLWDVVDRKPVDAYDGGTHSLAFHPDGRILAAASLDQSIRVWQIGSNSVVAELTGHHDHVNAVAFSPDGRWLASASDDRSVRLWDAQSWEHAAVCHLDSHVKDLCFSPDARFLYTANGNTTCYLLDLQMLLA
jgi:WD40 repeat protein